MELRRKVARRKGCGVGRRKGEDQIKLRFGFRMEYGSRRGRDWRRAACVAAKLLAERVIYCCFRLDMCIREWVVGFHGRGRDKKVYVYV